MHLSGFGCFPFQVGCYAVVDLFLMLNQMFVISCLVLVFNVVLSVFASVPIVQSSRRERERERERERAG